MTENANTGPPVGKSETEWAWEFHKQCDNLLHSRLAAYFTGQSFLVTAFVISKSNFMQFGHPTLIALCVVGFLTSLLWLFVNVSMYIRLEGLNRRYLFTDSPGGIGRQSDPSRRIIQSVFTYYIDGSIKGRNLWIPMAVPVGIYKTFIPYFTPTLFVILWIFLSIFHLAR